MTTVLEPGSEIWGRFEVDRLLGRGGFGAVYRARQKTTGQWVAIKVLHANLSGEYAARFESEMSVLAKLNHPNIVQLLDHGTLGAQRLMVLEFCDGQTLSQHIKSNGPMTIDVAVRVISQVLEALDVAHEHGILHRDLKPANIILIGPANRPSVKLLDFGVATALEHYDGEWESLTETGVLAGTPAYMDPELMVPQASGRRVPHVGSDLYAVGLMLFECLTGVRAVQGSSPQEICIRQIQHPLPIPPELRTHPLGEIVERACSKHSAGRYPDTESMLDALRKHEPYERGTLAEDSTLLERHIESLIAPVDLTPTETQPPRVPQQAPAAPQSAPWIGVFALILIFCIGGGIWYLNSPRADVSVPDPVRAPETIRLDIRSEPSGAHLFRDGVLVGRTPAKLPLDPSELPVSLSAEKEGYVPLIFTVKNTDVISLELEPTVKSNPTDSHQSPDEKPLTEPSTAEPEPDRAPVPKQRSSEAERSKGTKVRTAPRVTEAKTKVDGEVPRPESKLEEPTKLEPRVEPERERDPEPPADQPTFLPPEY